jgi:AcrR family transcriptional regulator
MRNLPVVGLPRKQLLSHTQIMPTRRPAPPRQAPRREPASAKSEQRIRDILRVGREVFAEKGYERATTIEIAQRLSISEATVFTYFHGKRELCVRVITDWYDEIIAAIEAGLPREAPARAQLDWFVRTHLRLFLIQGTGMCALVLSEGRSKGQDFSDVLLPLQRRYTAPLMDLLARGQASGEFRGDVPLRLLRPLVLGPMEHILWEAVVQGAEPGSKPVDTDATAQAVSAMLWSALQAPGAELAGLRTLRGEVAQALRRAG